MFYIFFGTILNRKKKKNIKHNTIPLRDHLYQLLFLPKFYKKLLFRLVYFFYFAKQSLEFYFSIFLQICWDFILWKITRNKIQNFCIFVWFYVFSYIIPSYFPKKIKIKIRKDQEEPEKILCVKFMCNKKSLNPLNWQQAKEVK